MNYSQWLTVSTLMGFACCTIAQPGRADEVNLDDPLVQVQTLVKGNALQDKPSLVPLSTRAADLLAQEAEPVVAEITGVQVNLGDEGVEIALETTAGNLTVPAAEVQDNQLYFDIPDAKLSLPEGKAFLIENPVAGIASVSVTQANESYVRVLVTGVDTVPKATLAFTEPFKPVTQVPEEDEELEITVTAERGEEGYNPADSSTATGTDTPLRDVPLSIQVIPKAVIEDRNATELGKALETAGGVVEAGGRGTSVFGPNLLIRGFPVSNGFFRDGIPAFSLSPLSTNDIERVEVLKGPASVLFGQGEPGGIINLVSKRPLEEPFYEISGTIGSFDTYSGAVDLSGPLNESKSVKYRLNLSYENYGSFRDFVDGERLIISPIVTWEIGPQTSLDFFGQYAYNRETIDDGIPAVGNGIADVPRSRFLGEDFGEFSQNEFKLGYRFKHDFSEDWSVRHSLQYLQYEPRRFASLFDSFDEATGDLQRLEYFAGGTYRRLFTNAEVTGRFKTGPIKHQVLVGVEYRHDAENPEFQFDDLYTLINVFNPVYTGVPYAKAPTFFRDDNQDTVSLYFQDQIEIIPQLKILAGLRYDYVDQFRTEQELGGPRAEFVQRDSAFTPRFGVVYQPIKPISLYASYTTSFNPSFGASRNADDSTFEPETGRQFEVGVKADLSNRLSLTLAAFDIRRQNVTTDDPNNPLFSIQTGEVASRGIELNVGGEILPGWNLTGAYTYLDAFVSQDNITPVGNRLANVPENQLSLWTTYEIQQGNLKGLGAGLGIFYVDARQGDLENTFTLPSYFRTDAALFYKRDNWRVQLNFENLFNTEYFTSTNFGSRLGANPGAPFGVSASFSVNF
ncbi:MAG: TonB-dependent siderophore receptor [Thermosynechococcaceae cyanobacterium]